MLRITLMISAVLLGATQAEAQVAFSRFNNSCTAFNACWQRLAYPSGTMSENDPRMVTLRACAAAGGPDYYFGKGKGGPGKLRTRECQDR